jgi:hypothetical protein
MKRCIEHALAAKRQLDEIGATTTLKPALFFVHDQGVYLMSNGEPRDMGDDGRTPYVAYAEGCNPETDENWWETSRDLVGGDDFVEELLIEGDWLKNCSECAVFELDVTPTEILGGFVDG